MNTRAFVRLTLVLGAVAAGIAVGVEFARRVRGALCDPYAVERGEQEVGGAEPTPEADGRKPVSSGG